MSIYALDLHSHSGYAGGVGDIRLEDISRTMKIKGIDCFGTGDCLLPARTKELKMSLRESAEGLFSLAEDKSSFMLQTEVIFTVPLEGYRNKIMAHHVILFPDFSAIEKMQILMNKWGQKNTIGRPFIVSAERNQMIERLFEIASIHPLLQIIPAHVMTPDGIMGEKNNLSCIEEFYGDFLPHIKIIETGLSASPAMLQTTKDFSQMTMLSNSDCHSSALNRVGREFFQVELEQLTYPNIINSLREKPVHRLIKFNSQEGRYYLTGHRGDKHQNKEEVYFLEEYPQDLICPVCGKKMHLGVAQRCKQLPQTDKYLAQSFISLIPLIDVIAFAYKTSSIVSKKVVQDYDQIIAKCGTEINMWQMDETQMRELLDNKINSNTLNHILAVRRGDFSFSPPGYDGEYGKLNIEIKEI